MTFLSRFPAPEVQHSESRESCGISAPLAALCPDSGFLEAFCLVLLRYCLGQNVPPLVLLRLSFPQAIDDINERTEMRWPFRELTENVKIKSKGSSSLSNSNHGSERFFSAEVPKLALPRKLLECTQVGRPVQRPEEAALNIDGCSAVCSAYRQLY